jgi:hypothetical protein
MNDGALWHLDANARNFAKLGQLMLAKGRGPESQIVPAEFIDTMLLPQ